MARAFSVRLACLLLVASVGGCNLNPQRASQRYLAGGDAYLSEDKIAEAIIEYRNAVQQDPLSFEARDKLGDVLAQVGDLGNAASELVSAADLRPEDPDVQVKAGSILLVIRQPAEARDRAEHALSLDAEHVGAHLLLAQALARLNDLDAAVAAAERAVALDPTQSGPHIALGSLQMDLDQHVRALASLRRAVAVDDHSAVPRLALARFHWVNGALDEAEASFRAAVRIAPDGLLANRSLAGFYVGTNRLLEAEPYLEAVAEIAETPMAQLMLATFYARTDRPARAVALLEPLTDDPTTAAQANVHLAALDYESGRTSDAHERLSMAVEGATNVPALLLSAELLLREERYDEALGRATAAAEADPRQARAQVLIGHILGRQGDVAEALAAFENGLALQPGDPFIARELARLHLRLGNEERAVRFAQEAVVGRPSDVEAFLLLSGALLADGQYDRAAEVLNPLIGAYPRLVPVRIQEGVLAARQGRTDAARVALGRALELDPENAAALNELVRLDLAEDDASGARGRADEWLEHRPDDPDRLRLVASVHAASGGVAEAERLLRRALEVDPANLNAYSQLARLYYRQGRLQDASREFEALAERSPTPAAAITMVGVLLQAQGRSVEARERFERAVELDPEAAVAANNLAWIYVEAGENMDRALSLAQRATARLPEMGETNDTLGWVYYKRNLADLAVPFFEKSIAIDSENAAYHYHLGLASAQTDNTERTRRAFERALELRTDFDGADDARRFLAVLPKKDS